MNYTEKDQGKDAPNQNFFNDKFSRVMNSSEIDDKGKKILYDLEATFSK